MEVSFSQEIRSLGLGTGATVHGEGLRAITKALLQPGVSYVGGYHGAAITAIGGVPGPMSPADSGARASIDGERFGALIRARNIRGD